MFPNDGGLVVGVGRSHHDFKWRLVGYHAFLDTLIWQSSCRDGSPELTLPRCQADEV